MTYILMIWTVVALAGDRHYQKAEYDWRPLGEFHQGSSGDNAEAKCQAAAYQLGIQPTRFRCVKAK